jgi:hypothetical protein
VESLRRRNPSAGDPALCATLQHLVGILNTARTDPGPPHSIVPLAFSCTPPGGLLFKDGFESGGFPGWHGVVGSTGATVETVDE